MMSNSWASDSTTTRKWSSSPREDRLAQRRARELEPARAQVGHRGHGGDLDLLLRQLLDVAQQAVLARLGERDRDAFAAGAARAADAVHVRLRRRRHVVVHDVRDVLDVEPARGDVGGDEQVGRVGAELLHHAVALLLRQAAVQRLGAIAAAVQRLGELVDLGARAAEHDRRRRVLDVEHAAERGDLVRARRRCTPPGARAARSRRGRPRGRCARARDRSGACSAISRDARRQRGGEERGLALRRASRARIASRSSAKPMSSISSASSSTTTFTRSSRSVLRRMWSSARPGRGDDDVDAALEQRAAAAPSPAPP